MKDLLANMFKAKDKADQELRQYQMEMDLKRAEQSMLMAEQARQMRNAVAQQGYGQAMPKREGGLIQGASGYQSGWQDPRVQLGWQNPVPIPSVEELYENVKRNNAIAKDLMHKIDRTEKKIEQLSGFYHWVTEVHPELAAQYKAMRDLYDAANNGPREEMGS